MFVKQKDLDPQDLFFLNLVGQNVAEENSFAREVGEFLTNARVDKKVGTKGLTAILLMRFFSGYLTPEQANELASIIKEAYISSPNVKRFMVYLQMMQRSIRDYFQHSQLPYACWLPTPPPELLEIQLLNLTVVQTVKQKESEFDQTPDSQMIIQWFENPQTNIYGVWMSKQGLPYDPKFHHNQGKSHV